MEISKGIRHPPDPLMADPAGRARPKLGSFDASRPGLFAPRPFNRDTLLQRERRSSDGASCTSEEDRHSQTSSTGSCGEPETRAPPSGQSSSAPRERIIPIRLEGDDEEEASKDPPPQRPLRKHERRDTVDGAGVETSVKGGEPRDARAQSCPVVTPAENVNTLGKSATKFAPLKVNEALASQQREAQSPGGRASYQNMSPKPFSPGARPFKSSSFGMFGSPTRSVDLPFGRGVESTAPRPPPVPPKPSAAEIHAARRQTTQQNPGQTHSQQNQQQEQSTSQQAQQQQQAQEQPKPQQPISAKDTALSKIATIRSDLDPVNRRLESFNGCRGDKEYLFLDEMLTRGLLKLDGLDTGGDADVRTARKEAVRSIEESLSTLERRSAGRDNPSAADIQKSASVVVVNGVRMSAREAEEMDRRATSAPPQGLARAEPVVVTGDPAEDNTSVKRRVSAEEMGRR
ncbi:BAG domain-containing protein Samui [Amphibalanus amphitrite]|uniref:BAG domain-containing protein Samui n=1 Tax=Amphibalanus amphitrite TaxID=1232801 RepID=A0A6A4VWK6_AMPAM|nr:BAG domain-containing protein Samui [Amphibalanus amphitrite]